MHMASFALDIWISAEGREMPRILRFCFSQRNVSFSVSIESIAQTMASIIVSSGRTAHPTAALAQFFCPVSLPSSERLGLVDMMCLFKGKHKTFDDLENQGRCPRGDRATKRLLWGEVVSAYDS